MEIKWNKLYNLYLWIVSFVSIVAIWINLWIVLTSVWKYFLVSDEEYLQFSQSYRLDACKNPTYPAWTTQFDSSWKTIPTVTKTPTDAEITTCEAKVREEVKFSRSYDLKDTFITSSAWFLVFLLFFLFHYPKFLKLRKED